MGGSVIVQLCNSIGGAVVEYTLPGRLPKDTIYLTPIGPLENGHISHPTEPVTPYRWTGETCYRGCHGPIHVFRDHPRMYIVVDAYVNRFIVELGHSGHDGWRWKVEDEPDWQGKGFEDAGAAVNAAIRWDYEEFGCK
jgi:hypothetical protein